LIAEVFAVVRGYVIGVLPKALSRSFDDDFRWIGFDMLGNPEAFAL
jgi:hypothetical protein